jgi:hypothetical protein
MNLLIHRHNQLFGVQQLKKSGHFGILSCVPVSRLTQQCSMVISMIRLNTLVHSITATFYVVFPSFSLRGMILMRGSYEAWQRQQRIGGKALAKNF